MNIDRLVFRVAGTMVLTSVAMAYWHRLEWLLLAAFVGVNMLQASFTRFCPLALIAKRLGVKAGQAF